MKIYDLWLFSHNALAFFSDVFEWFNTTYQVSEGFEYWGFRYNGFIWQLELIQVQAIYITPIQFMFGASLFVFLALTIARAVV